MQQGTSPQGGRRGTALFVALIALSAAAVLAFAVFFVRTVTAPAPTPTPTPTPSPTAPPPTPVPTPEPTPSRRRRPSRWTHSRRTTTMWGA